MQELDPHPLQRGVIIGSARSHSEYAYFIDSGVVSLVAHTKNGSSVEVALVGREGVAGIADALGAHALPYGLDRAAARPRLSRPEGADPRSTSCRAARCTSC